MSVPSLTASMMLHLYPGVPVRVTLQPSEDRAVVAIGTGTLLLDLFCDRAELMALRDTLTAAVVDLDAARHTNGTSVTTSETSEGDAGQESAVPADEVRTPAA